MTGAVGSLARKKINRVDFTLFHLRNFEFN